MGSSRSLEPFVSPSPSSTLLVTCHWYPGHLPQGAPWHLHPGRSAAVPGTAGLTSPRPRVAALPSPRSAFEPKPWAIHAPSTTEQPESGTSQRTTELAWEARCPKCGGTALPNESTFLSPHLPSWQVQNSGVLVIPGGGHQASRLTQDSERLPHFHAPFLGPLQGGEAGGFLPTSSGTPMAEKGIEHSALIVFFSKFI